MNSKQSQSETHVCSIVIFFECSFMYDIGWRTPALQTAANHVGIYVTLLASMMYVWALSSLVDNGLLWCTANISTDKGTTFHCVLVSNVLLLHFWHLVTAQEEMEVGTLVQFTEVYLQLFTGSE